MCTSPRPLGWARPVLSRSRPTVQVTSWLPGMDSRICTANGSSHRYRSSECTGVPPIPETSTIAVSVRRLDAVCRPMAVLPGPLPRVTGRCTSGVVTVLPQYRHPAAGTTSDGAVRWCCPRSSFPWGHRGIRSDESAAPAVATGRWLPCTAGPQGSLQHSTRRGRRASAAATNGGTNYWTATELPAHGRDHRHGTGHRQRPTRKRTGPLRPLESAGLSPNGPRPSPDSTDHESWRLSLIHISEPTRRTPRSYAVFCL